MVAYNYYPFGAGMQLKGQINGGLKFHALRQTRKVTSALQHRLLEIIDPAENHWNLAKQPFLIFEKKTQRIVIGGDNSIQCHFIILQLQHLAKKLEVLFKAYPLCVHILDMDFNVFYLSEQNCLGPAYLVICPFEPFMVGVKDENFPSLPCLMLGRTNANQENGQKKHGKKM